MDVTTHTIEPAEAATQLEAYRTIKAPNDEEQAIIAALTAAMAGKAIVNLREALLAGGTFDEGDNLHCPHLAASVPMYRWCYVSRSQAGTMRYRPTDSSRAEKDNFRAQGFDKLDWRTLDKAGLHDWGRHGRRTQVPIVPPAHRVRGWKTRCVVLWEVEEWATVRLPVPPGDPMLLRHLTGDLYSVEAVWDLTPLEQLVLGARQPD